MAQTSPPDISTDETRDWVRHQWYAPARGNVGWLRALVTAGALVAVVFHIALQAGWLSDSRHSLALLVLMGPLLVGIAPAMVMAFGMEGELRRLLRVWPRWVIPSVAALAIYASVIGWRCHQTTSQVQGFQYFDHAIWAKAKEGPLRRSSAAEMRQHHRAWAMGRSTAMLPFYAFALAVLWKREDLEV